MMRLLALLLAFASPAFGAGKDYVPGFVLVPATTLGASFTSPAVDTRGWDNIDFEIVATGTPTGGFFVDCTLNQQQPPASTSPTWVELTLSPAPALAGAGSNIIIELNQTGCSYLRLRYVRASGTGTATVYASEKQI